MSNNGEWRGGKGSVRRNSNEKLYSEADEEKKDRATITTIIGNKIFSDNELKDLFEGMTRLDPSKRFSIE